MMTFYVRHPVPFQGNHRASLHGGDRSQLRGHEGEDQNATPVSSELLLAHLVEHHFYRRHVVEEGENVRSNL